MNFTEGIFFIFLPVTLGLYYLLPRGWRRFILLFASYAFYAWYDLGLLSLILLTTLVTYICALKIGGANTKAKKRLWLIAGLTVCFELLFLFKYLGLTLETLRFWGLLRECPALGLALPMGISFYTFQTAAYAADVYRGTVPPERDLISYALFVVFFPQLVAGPIERSGDLLPRLKTCPSASREDLAAAVRLLVRGYAKKLLLSDLPAAAIDRAYGMADAAGGCALAVATVLFAFRIYGDFSGYSDIALGVARLFGVRLTQNFDRPYSAPTVREFWRRWHITLTRFFRDYVYIPLGGGRRGLLRTCLNTLIVFFLSGLWHGADWSFVCWGLLHGLYLTAGTLWAERKRPLQESGIPAGDAYGKVRSPACFPQDEKPPAGTAFGRQPFTARSPLALPLGELSAKPTERAKNLLRRLRTFLLVCAAWVFFRAESVGQALAIYKAMFTRWSFGTCMGDLGVTMTELLLFAACILSLPVLERLPLPRGPAAEASKDGPAVGEQDCGALTRSLIYGAVILLCLLARIAVLRRGGNPSFIYFQF